MQGNDDRDQTDTTSNPSPFMGDQTDLLQSIGFGRQTLWMGLLLLVIGALGIALPPLLAVTTADVVGLILLVGGGVWGWHSMRHGGGVMNWLKPALLVATGFLMAINPFDGVAALALLLSVYLLMDAFGSFALAQALRPERGWIWMVINGVMDLLLALLFILTWPGASMWLVGLFVGISLVFDGTALIAIGWALRKAAR
jgi:uncharacterized membrane protein HdeD (DUF308 family)